MRIDFDRVIPRRGTASEKWDIPRGEDVLPLWVADMDFRAAPAIVDALHRRVDEGVFGYALPPHAWHDSLRRWLHRRHGWKVESSSILDATGVIPALAATIRAFCVPGDKVIVQTPVYNCFFRTIRNQGCEVLESPLRRVAAKDGSNGDFSYEMDFDDLERKVSDPRAKLFLLCNPHNPVGRAWTDGELRLAGEICLYHGVAVASDEIHADLQMPFSRHVPFARISRDFSEASITFWSASKAFNLAGLQTAAVICEHDAARERIKHFLNVHGTGELNPFGFIAASAAWGKSEEWLDELREYLSDNYRDVSCLGGRDCAWLRFDRACRTAGIRGKGQVFARCDLRRAARQRIPPHQPCLPAHYAHGRPGAFREMDRDAIRSIPGARRPVLHERIVCDMKRTHIWMYGIISCRENSENDRDSNRD